MIHFAVAMGPPGSCAGVGRELRAAIEATSSIGGRGVEATSPTDAWAMHAVAAPDAPSTADGSSTARTWWCATAR